MKHFIQILFISLFICAVSFPFNQGIAQNKNKGRVLSGTIADSTTGKPLGYVTLSLKNAENKEIGSVSTDTSGIFTLPGIGPEKYMVTITAVGYTSKTVSLNFTDSVKQRISLGTIYLTGRQNSLKEVAITADRQIIKRKADRIIYDLQADPESRGSSVFDMLRKVPYVSIDGNNNILLKGNADFKVFLNGKPSPMLQGNLNAILQSMPASTIQSIEVITIPPSKYDAEGLAGIINIITNKKVDDGYSGTLNVNETAPDGGPGGGGSFTVKEGKLGISAYGGLSHSNTPQITSNSSRITTGADASNLAQNGYSKNNRDNQYFGTQLSYEIDSLNLISAEFNGSHNRGNGSSFQTSQLTGGGALLQGYDLDNINNYSGGGFDAALNYQLGFKADKNRLLTFSYQYSQYGGNSHNNILLSDTVNFPTPDYKQYNDQQSDEQTVQVDYVLPIKKLNFEAGLKAIFRDNKSNSDYSSLDSATNVYNVVPAFGDDYKNTQDVFSAYNSYELNLKSWDFHGGLRLEQTLINADFISTGTPIKQHYLNLVPAIAVNKTFADRSSLSFGFSQRIKRPSIDRLNPYVDRSNPDVETSGNPYLRPDIINEIQAGYSMNKKVSVNLGINYVFVKNLDLQVATFDPVNKVTLFTYQNVGWVSGLGANVNINYPVTQKYNMSLNGNAMYFTLSGTVNGVLVRNTVLLPFFNFSNAYNFGSGWRANADLAFTGKSPTSLQGTTNGFASTSFGVNKELVKNKLNFSAGIKNPFTKFRYNTAYTNGTDFEQYSTSQQYFRSFNLSLNYNFGKLKDGVKKSRKQINNDDVSGGGF